MLISIALVILMTIPGVAMFYSGLIRRQNVLNTMLLSFVTFAIVSIIWFICGYDLVFGQDIWGAIATGLFAAPFINSLGTGLFYENPEQLWIQIIAVAVVAVYSFVVTLIIGLVIKYTMGLRVDEREEIEGLDTNLHEESGYRI